MAAARWVQFLAVAYTLHSDLQYFYIYYEYKMAKGINEIQRNNDHHVAKGLPGFCILFAIFDWIILGQLACLAIHQAEINKFYSANSEV